MLLATGAVALLLSAWIHVHLWSGRYRHYPTVAPWFVAQAIAGAVAAAALLLTRRALVALLGAGLLAATAGGLLLSHWFGLFGYRERLDVPYAGMSLVVELAGAAALVLAALLLRRRRRASR